MLITQINQRNERVARSYLDQLSGRMRTGGLHVRSLVLSGGDVRRQLSTAIGEQATDLLVLASHGRSGYADVPFGDVANFLISRSQVPTLVVRFGDTALTPMSSRRPGQRALAVPARCCNETDGITGLISVPGR